MAAVLTTTTAAIVPLTFNGLELPCRLDTGSPCSFISPHVLSRLNPAPPRAKESSRFVSVDGTPFAVDESVTITVQPPGWTGSELIHFFVLPSLSDILLGEDALSRLGCNINYRSQSVSFVESRPVATVAPLKKLSDGEFLRQFDMGGLRDCGDLKRLLLKYRGLFSADPSDIGRTSLAEHHIETGDCPAIFVPPYRRSRTENAEIERHVESMLAHDVIEQANSPWGSPVFLTEKKDGTKRFVVDFRKLNSITEKSHYPIPHIDDALDQVAGATIFSTVDLTAGYWQVPLATASKPKTAFQTTSGQYQFKVMPFGLTNAPATFQRLMRTTLRGLDVPVYLDDVIIPSRNEPEHLSSLEELFNRLLNAGLKLKPAKCHFGKRKVEYLGFIVGEGRLAPNPDRVAAIRDYPTPATPLELQRFLGMALFYSRFVRHFAEIASPLYRLQHLSPKSFLRRWSQEHTTAFNALRMALSDPAWLAQPDFSRPFVVEVDASQFALGAVLYQTTERPIAFASRVLTASEKNYSTVDRELLALSWALQHFRPYVHGSPFVAKTDHKPLIGLYRGNPRSDRQRRLLSKIADFDFELHHITGSDNVIADALSRIPGGTLNPLAPPFVPKISSAPAVAAVQAATSTPPTPQELIQQYHNSGHFGIEGTRKSLRMAGYSFPYMRRLIREFVATCSTCANKSYGSTGIPRGQLPTAKDVRPFEFVSIDIVGPLPRCRNFRYLLTMVDHSTRWLEAIPLTMIDATTVTNAFMRHWVYRFGAPRVLHSDQGRQFESAVLRNALEAVGCSRSRTTAYHPQGNAVVERVHRTLKDRLRCYGGDWVDNLGRAVFDVNRLSSDTDPAPFERLYGSAPQLPANWPTPDTPACDPSLVTPRFVYPRYPLPPHTLAPRFAPRIAVQSRISPTLVVAADGRTYNLQNCRIVW